MLLSLRQAHSAGRNKHRGSRSTLRRLKTCTAVFFSALENKIRLFFFFTISYRLKGRLQTSRAQMLGTQRCLSPPTERARRPPKRPAKKQQRVEVIREEGFFLVKWWGEQERDRGLCDVASKACVAWWGVKRKTSPYPLKGRPLACFLSFCLPACLALFCNRPAAAKVLA